MWHEICRMFETSSPITQLGRLLYVEFLQEHALGSFSILGVSDDWKYRTTLFFLFHQLIEENQSWKPTI